MKPLVLRVAILLLCSAIVGSSATPARAFCFLDHCLKCLKCEKSDACRQRQACRKIKQAQKKMRAKKPLFGEEGCIRGMVRNVVLGEGNGQDAAGECGCDCCCAECACQ